MKLTSSYVVGVLEHINQSNGLIIVRTKDNRKVKVFDKDQEMDEPEPFGDLCMQISKKKVTLSHPIEFFAEGDEVRVTRFYKDGTFGLDNLTIPKLRTLDELLPKTLDKELFNVEIKGNIVHICRMKGKGKVVLRIKCFQRSYGFVDDEYSDKVEEFKETICGEIPIDHLRLGLGMESIAAYKKGDKVNLSRTCFEDNMYDFDNLTLSLFYATPKYKSQWDL